MPVAAYMAPRLGAHPYDIGPAAYSFSGNLLYSPLPPLTFGVELMRAYRKLEDGTTGKFDRLQFSGEYDFGFAITAN